MTETTDGEADREAQGDWYDRLLARHAARRERAETGRVLVRRAELEPWQTKNGRYYVYMTEEYEDLAYQDWRVFAHEIAQHSGRHTHQGGIMLYIIKGRGYTEVEGVIKHWKAGDLLLLPIVPGGVAHQHWNEDPDEPSEWIAFRYKPHQDAMGTGFSHEENSPDYKESAPTRTDVAEPAAEGSHA